MDRKPLSVPDPMGELLVRAKRQIRQRMRSLRGALPALSIAKRSAAIVERVTSLPEFASADSIATFWPMAGKNEVDLRALDAAARAAGKRVYYPIMTAAHGVTHTGFRRVDDVSQLAERGHGFLEPPEDAPLAERGDVALVLVPALAADTSGRRVGYGIGFYDATLPDVRPPAAALVVVFDFQLLGELPCGSNDVACDLVVSDERVLRVDATAEP
jgi:5-formyltetrahydrofolate cyclo-ligase